MRKTGRIKWFNNTKGWGFIQSDDSIDIFVHYSSLKGKGFKTLKQGDVVEYDEVQGQKGLQASDVIVVTPASAQGATEREKNVRRRFSKRSSEEE